jgi:hypothetical protein
MKQIKKFIGKCWLFLQGKKTSIAAILALLITIAKTQGWIDNEVAIALSGLLVALGLTANTVNYIQK